MIKKKTESNKIIYPKGEIFDRHITNTYFYRKPHRKKRPNLLGRRSIFLTFCAIGLAVTGGLYTTAGPFFNNYYINFIRGRFESSKMSPLVYANIVNKKLIKKLEFVGTARPRSKILEDSIILNNSKKYSWGEMSLDFRFPLNLCKRNISMSLRGRMGGEKINIILKDTQNRSLAVRDLYLTSTWKTETITLDNVHKDIDLSKTAQIRLECSFAGDVPDDKTRSSALDTTIYLRELLIYKIEESA